MHRWIQRYDGGDMIPPWTSLRPVSEGNAVGVSAASECTLRVRWRRGFFRSGSAKRTTLVRDGRDLSPTGLLLLRLHRDPLGILPNSLIRMFEKSCEGLTLSS